MLNAERLTRNTPIAGVCVPRSAFSVPLTSDNHSKKHYK
jgi:hypothetical protein